MSLLVTLFRFLAGRIGKKMGSGPMMGLGKSNAKVYKENDIKYHPTGKFILRICKKCGRMETIKM